MANATLNIAKLKEKQTATFDIEGGREYIIYYTPNDMGVISTVYGDIVKAIQATQHVTTDGQVDFDKFNASSKRMTDVTNAAIELINRLIGAETFGEITHEYDLTFDLSTVATFLLTITEAIRNKVNAEQTTKLKQELETLENV